MPRESTQSTKSLPAQCIVSSSPVRCGTWHSHSVCCMVLVSLQCKPSAVLPRPHLNMLLRHLVCWVWILLHIDRCFWDSVRNPKGSVVGSRMMLPLGWLLAVQSHVKFVIFVEFCIGGYSGKSVL